MRQQPAYPRPVIAKEESHAPGPQAGGDSSIAAVFQIGGPGVVAPAPRPSRRRANVGSDLTHTSRGDAILARQLSSGVAAGLQVFFQVEARGVSQLGTPGESGVVLLIKPLLNER
jgi:hypothetical protein